MALRVVLRRSALEDLQSIFSWIDAATGPQIAHTYVRRIRDQCSRLGDFPKRGRSRDDLAPGVLTIPFERAALIAYRVSEDEVQIVRILHKGRDISGAFPPQSSSSS